MQTDRGFARVKSYDGPSQSQRGRVRALTWRGGSASGKARRMVAYMEKNALLPVWQDCQPVDALTYRIGI
jgi:hypothetical protein